MKNKIKICSIFGHKKYTNLKNFLVAVELNESRNDQNSNLQILNYFEKHYLGNSVPNSNAAFSGSLVGVNKLAGFVTSAMV